MKVWQINHKKRDKNIEKLVETFTAKEDIIYDKKLAFYDILGSIAHVMGLKSIGLISEEEAKRLKSALVDLLDEEIELTPEDEDIHSKIECLLTQRLGKLGEKLHTGRSRNDQILVDTRLYIKDNIFINACKLLELAQSLLDLASQNQEVPMPGYTHSRKAMPSSVGLWASSFVEAITDDLMLLETVLSLCDQSPLGAGAGYGVPLNLNRKLTADLLGFRKVQNNSLYVMNSRGKFEFTILSCLGGINLDLSRLCSDLILFSSPEFNFFELPAVLTTGSSIMPHKKNPDVLELIRGRSSRLLGNISLTYSLLVGLTSGYSRDLQEVKGPLMEGFEITENSAHVLSLVIRGLEVNEKILREACDLKMMITDKVFALVREGQTFRSAYKKIKKEMETKAAKPISKQEIDRAIRARTHQGGLANLGLDNLRSEIEEKKSEWETAKKDFHKTLDQLITSEES